MSIALFLQLFEPAARADPYPVCRRILEECPVFEGPFGAIVLSRYADCWAVLRDPRASTDQRHSTTYQNAVASGELHPVAEAPFEQPSFLFLDPPDHTRLRRLVSKAFTPRVVEALRPTVQRWVDELIDRAAANHRIELIADLAFPLPVRVICQMLGVPAEDQPKFRAWSRDLERGLDPVETLSADEQDRMVSALEALTAYFDGLIDRRRAELRRGSGKPATDDLLSALIAVEEQGDQLTTAELNATCRLLLLAGHVTTVNLIANGMLALLRHPDQLERLRTDRSLVESAVEEVLRYDPPVQFAGRVAREPLDVGGVTISRGERIVLLLAAAQRDPARFADPHRFDITRASNPHLTFGAGIHFCLGAPLARLEGQVALAALAARLIDPVLEVDPPPYKDHIVLRGPEALPIAFSDVKPA